MDDGSGIPLFEAGHQAEVWSNSLQQFIPCKVKEVTSPDKKVTDRGMEVPDGAYYVEYGSSAKWILPVDVEFMLRHPKPIISTGSVSLCKHGCGCQVQPGLTRNLNPYDTCCKQCSQTKGHGGHSNNCLGAPGSETNKGGARAVAEDGRRGLSIKELETMATSSGDSTLQKFVVERLKEVVDGKKPPPSITMDQMKRMYKEQLCLLLHLDDNWEKGDEAKMSKLTGGKPNCEPADILAFCKDLIQKNLSSNLQPDKIEIRRQMLVRQNKSPVGDSYIKGKLLGQGSFGIVEGCETKMTREQRVMKTIRFDGLNNGSNVDELFEEIKIMAELDHPGILKMYEYYLTKDTLILILEKADGGELWDHMKRHEKDDGPTKERWCYRIMLQVCRALAFMHDKPRIAHKDLKPDNVLLVAKDSDSIKIIDFGLAEAFGKRTTSDVQCGTPLFSSPEILAEKPFDFKVDVWSSGVIMFNMLEGHQAFPATTLKELKDKVCDVKKPPPVPSLKDLSADCKDIIKLMLTKEAKNRPTAEKILQHPWFTKMHAACNREDARISPGIVQVLQNYHKCSELKKAVYYYIAYMSSFATANDSIRVLFTHLDKTNTGTVLQEDIKNCIMKAGLGRGEAMGIASALTRIRGNDFVTWTEFVAAVISTRVSQREEHLLRVAFEKFDAQHKGYIQVEDLEKALSNSSLGGHALLHDEFAHIEKKDKKLVSQAEFQKMMKQVGATASGDALVATT